MYKGYYVIFSVLISGIYFKLPNKKNINKYE